MYINGERHHLGVRLYQRKEESPHIAVHAAPPPRDSVEPGYEIVWYPHRDAPSLLSRPGWPHPTKESV